MSNSDSASKWENNALNQLWARYLEGDNISTKIGSGRDRDRGGLPDFLKNRDRDRGGLSKKSGRVGGIGILFERSRDKSG